MLLLLLGLGSACTSEPGSGITPPRASTNQETVHRPTAEAGEAEPVRIEYWHVNSENFGGPAIEKLVQSFQERYPHITVAAVFQPGSYQGLMQGLQASIAAGTPPAVAQIGFNYLDYVVENVPFVPVEEVLKRDPDSETFLRSFPASVLNLGRRQGTLAGFPYSISVPVLYYNADLFSRAGLDPDRPPRTWSEVRTLSREIKQKTGQYGLFVEDVANWAIDAMVLSNDGAIYRNVGGRTEPAFQEANGVAVYQMLQEMALQEKTLFHATQKEGQQAFLDGKVAMIVQTVGLYRYLTSSSAFEVRTALFPVFDGKPRKVPAGGNALMVFTQNPNEQAAAWEWIRFLNSPEALAIWVEETGYLPHRDDWADSPALRSILEERPVLKIARQQLADVVPWPSFSGGNSLEAEQIRIEATEAILSGKKSPSTALEAASENIHRLLP